MRTRVGPATRPGIVVSMATSGDLLQRHPHGHILVTDRAPIRWTFTEFTPDSFRWTGEALEPDGQTWRLDGELLARQSR